jgi:hypothetical protein
MKTIIVWEDESQNRTVNFDVDYTITDVELSVNSIVPTKVNFTCPVSNVVLRTIGVHTDKGRQLLTNRFIECGQLEVLISAIAEHNDLKIASQI